MGSPSFSRSEIVERRRSFLRLLLQVGRGEVAMGLAVRRVVRDGDGGASETRLTKRAGVNASKPGNASTV